MVVSCEEKLPNVEGRGLLFSSCSMSVSVPKKAFREIIRLAAGYHNLLVWLRDGSLYFEGMLRNLASFNAFVLAGIICMQLAVAEAPIPAMRCLVWQESALLRGSVFAEAAIPATRRSPWQEWALLRGSVFAEAAIPAMTIGGKGLGSASPIPLLESANNFDLIAVEGGSCLLHHINSGLT